MTFSMQGEDEFSFYAHRRFSSNFSSKKSEPIFSYFTSDKAEEIRSNSERKNLENIALLAQAFKGKNTMLKGIEETLSIKRIDAYVKRTNFSFPQIILKSGDEKVDYPKEIKIKLEGENYSFNELNQEKLKKLKHLALSTEQVKKNGGEVSVEPLNINPYKNLNVNHDELGILITEYKSGMTIGKSHNMTFIIDETSHGLSYEINLEEEISDEDIKLLFEKECALTNPKTSKLIMNLVYHEDKKYRHQKLKLKLLPGFTFEKSTLDALNILGDREPFLEMPTNGNMVESQISSRTNYVNAFEKMSSLSSNVKYGNNDLLNQMIGLYNGTLKNDEKNPHPFAQAALMAKRQKKFLDFFTQHIRLDKPVDIKETLKYIGEHAHKNMKISNIIQYK